MESPGHSLNALDAGLFRIAFETAPDPTMISEYETGRLLAVNPGFERHFGWTAAEAEGRSSVELGLMSTQVRATFLAAFGSDGRLQGFEAELTGRYGQRAQYLLYGGRTRLGERDCLLTTIRDVSEQRSQAAALRESQERLKLALDSVELGIWELHVPSNMIHASSRAAKLQGLGHSAFHGTLREFFAQVPGEDQGRMYRIYHDLTEGRHSEFQISYRCRLPEGEIRHLESTAKLYRDTEGRPLRMAGILMDITERQRGEIALRISEMKFARAFHCSPDAIVILERDSGRLIEVNEGFTRLTGYTCDEAIGLPIGKLRLWNAAGQRRRILEKLRRDGRLLHSELAGRDRYGRNMFVDVSIEPIELDDVQCLLLTARDTSQLKQAQAQIHHLAYHDSLTGLPNRALLMDRLTQQIALHKRHALRGALLFIDLDHFKHINDSLGHPVGDAVLKMVTARLEASVRQEDTVARLGGDEFVVLLTGLAGRRSEVTRLVRQVADKLRGLLAEPMRFESHHLSVTPSIGIALMPDHGATPADLLKRADIALYRAKDAGRNAIQIFRSTMQEAASERLRMENDLRQALVRQEFELHLQPQVDARNNSIVGAEVLLRWRHPVLGPQSPYTCESGLIVEVGNWVLTEASRIGARLVQEGLIEAEHFSLCVNISPRQFRQNDFVEQVDRVIQGSGLPRWMIKLEITEGIVVQNLDDTIGKMNRLKKLGITFAMDDFGTGYSSLTYLKRMPVEVLKIDQSFVRDAIAGDGDAEIIRAIVSMATSLGLQVIAEGVEQQAQLDVLQARNCHLYQGYLFSRPVPFEDFRRLLRENRGRLAANA